MIISLILTIVNIYQCKPNSWRVCVTKPDFLESSIIHDCPLHCESNPIQSKFIGALFLEINSYNKMVKTRVQLYVTVCHSENKFELILDFKLMSFIRTKYKSQLFIQWFFSFLDVLPCIWIEISQH